MNIDELVKAFNDSLRVKFDELSRVPYNPNVKGEGYEKILKTFLETYLGGVFTFDKRVALIDDAHKLIELLKPGENEFDVVATYKTSFPSKVFEFEGLTYVSYDSCAFIVEVAQTMTKGQLEDDLAKLRKLNALGIRGGMASYVGGPNTIMYPPRILFYAKQSMKNEVFTDMLNCCADGWELVLVLGEDLLIVNAKLPIVRPRSLPMVKDSLPKSNVTIKENALLWMFEVLSDLLPYPLIVDAFGPFRSAIFSAIEK